MIEIKLPKKLRDMYSDNADETIDLLLNINKENFTYNELIHIFKKYELSEKHQKIFINIMEKNIEKFHHAASVFIMFQDIPSPLIYNKISFFANFIDDVFEFQEIDVSTIKLILEKDIVEDLFDKSYYKCYDKYNIYYKLIKHQHLNEDFIQMFLPIFLQCIPYDSNNKPLLETLIINQSLSETFLQKNILYPAKDDYKLFDEYLSLIFEYQELSLKFITKYISKLKNRLNVIFQKKTLGIEKTNYYIQQKYPSLSLINEDYLTVLDVKNFQEIKNKKDFMLCLFEIQLSKASYNYIAKFYNFDFSNSNDKPNLLLEFIEKIKDISYNHYLLNDNIHEIKKFIAYSSKALLNEDDFIIKDISDKNLNEKYIEKVMKYFKFSDELLVKIFQHVSSLCYKRLFRTQKINIDTIEKILDNMKDSENKKDILDICMEYNEITYNFIKKHIDYYKTSELFYKNIYKIPEQILFDLDIINEIDINRAIQYRPFSLNFIKKYFINDITVKSFIENCDNIQPPLIVNGVIHFIKEILENGPR